MGWDLFVSQSIKNAGKQAPIWILVFVSLAMWLPFRSATKAYCACCANPGVWSLETRKLDSESMTELNRVKPAEQAEFYVTDAWPDDVSGVALAGMGEPKPFVVSLVREPRSWKFFFKASNGATGALVLTLPGVATFYHVDNEPRPKSDNKTPTTVYKEVRLEGAVRGTGIFAKGIVPTTKFRLILQGKGNMCLNAEDFQRWHLRISGPQASFTLFGDLARPLK